MRYPRNAKIFRGQVDAAPFAGVFFLLLLFMLLFNTHVFIPGVRVDLGGKPVAPELIARTVKVLRSGSIEFEGSDYSFLQFQTELKERAQKGTVPKRVIFENEPGTKEPFVDRVQQLLLGQGVALKSPGARMELPEATGFPGSPNKRVVVAMNLNGQKFYQQQLVTDELLFQKLAEAVRQNRPTGTPLTMVLQADRNVPYGKITDLCEIARKAGIDEVTFAHRPNLIE
jgi:biopolymer transport protein ExbD